MLDLLADRARTHPRHVFIHHGEHAYTFAEAAVLAGQTTAWLRRQGVGEGTRAVLAASNRPLFLFLWLGALGCGATVVPVSTDLAGEHLRYVIEDSGARFVLAEAAFAPSLASVAASAGARLIAFASEDDLPDGLDQGATASGLPDAREAIAAILYTSGTTGVPKGVMIPAASYAAAGREIVRAIGIGDADRILTFLPLHHANPQMYALMSALLTGCALVLLPRFSASGLLRDAQRYRATGFTYVGTVLSILSKTIGSPQESPLRWCVGGGAPLDVWRDIEHKLGVRVHELYGMTETGGVTTINTSTDTRIGSVGKPRADFEVAVLDAHDEVLGTDTVGEIAVRPRHAGLITSGYCNKPRETLECLANLWFHTGDLGRFDADGFLYFEGRKKDLFRRAGEMVSPSAIEIVAARHPQVSECAAVAVPDDILGEEIKLAVVSRGDIDMLDLARHLARHLRSVEMPRYVDVVDRIPKTSTEKIQRFKLVENGPRAVDLRELLAHATH